MTDSLPCLHICLQVCDFTSVCQNTYLKDIHFRERKFFLEKPSEQRQFCKVQQHPVKGEEVHGHWLADEVSWWRKLLICMAVAHWHVVTTTAYLPVFAKANKQMLDQLVALGFSGGLEPFFSSYSQLLFPLKTMVEVHWHLIQAPSQRSQWCAFILLIDPLVTANYTALYLQSEIRSVRTIPKPIPIFQGR